MIYKLFRKEMNARTPQLLSSSTAEESLFMEEISRYVKLIKKKQVLYLKILEDSCYGSRKTFQEQNNYSRQFENLIEQGKALDIALSNFRKETFYASKTYFYSVYMRIRELLDAQAMRFKGEAKKQLEKYFQEAKANLSDIYSNLVFQENYEVSPIIEFIINHQDRRINKLLPKRSQTILQPLSRPNKLLQKLKQPSESHLRKTISVEIVKTKQSKLQDLVNHKLIVRQLATEKRIQQRKQSKPKKVNLFKLYDILELRPLTFNPIEAFKQDIEKNMLDRNKVLKEYIKQYEKKYLSFKYSKKERN